MKIGYLKRFPKVLLIVQGETDNIIWFHGLSEIYPISDFVEMEAHPCLNKFKTISEQEILTIFKFTEQ